VYGCQQNLINPDVNLKAILEFICSESHKLTNCGIYYARQLFFQTRKIIGKYDLEKEYKTNRHYQVLHSQAAQQILRTVAESFKSFKELEQKYRKGELHFRPKAPDYRKKDGIDGRKVKSLNQWYNKRVSTLKEGKPQGYWDDQLAHITEKRNRQMRDAVNKAARLVIDHCIKYQIGTVVFGWNQGQRQEAALGKTTQSFVQIPTAKLKERIKQLCEEYCIKFVETEESYTSKSSFLDGDFLPTFGAKPEGWKPSGKRVKRGMYRTGKGQLINADLNGAANILRKVETQLGLSLVKVCRQVLTLATRFRIWETKTKKRSGTASACHVATV